MKGAVSATMELPSDESLVVHAFAHKITLKQFSLEKNACENSVLEKWALKPSGTDPTRTGDETWLNWKVYSLLWSRLFGDTLGEFPFKEPVEGRPLGYAGIGTHAAESVCATETIRTAETVRTAESVSQNGSSTTSNTKSQTDVQGQGPTAPRQPTARKAQPQRQFPLPADIQSRPAVLDLDSDDMPQYSAIFPASITRHIFDKVGGVDGKAQVEVFNQHYKNCSINAALDSKRRIITVWSEPRGYTGTLTEEVEKELAESAIFLATYSNEAWKKDTVQANGPPMTVFFAAWLKEKAKVQFGHDQTQPAATIGKQREIRIEYHEGTITELTRWWVAPAVPMNMTTGEAILVDPAEIAARGPLMEGENALTVAKRENDRRERIAAYERKVRMIQDDFMGTTTMPEVYFDELEKSSKGLSGIVPTITAKTTVATKNTQGHGNLINLSPEETPKPVVTLADLERTTLANSKGAPRNLIAEMKAERDKLAAGLDRVPLANPSGKPRNLAPEVDARVKWQTENAKMKADIKKRWDEMKKLNAGSS